jgi:hypothetical protein
MEKEKRCFVIMPFGKYGTEEFQRNLKIYQIMIKPVVEAMGYQSIRADELEHMGNITRDIIELLHESDLVIADLSGKNANVFYELGVRHALYRCGTIPIIREGETLPFDIANYRAVFYSSELDGPEQFRKELERRIKAFERFQERKSDNPVHDILGDKLIPRTLEDYVEKKLFQDKVTELKSLTQETEKLRQQEKDAKSREKDLQKQVKDISKETVEAIQKIKMLETKISELENELQQAREIVQRKEKLKPTLESLPSKFRSKPATLSNDQVKSMLKKNDFYCREADWSIEFCNPDGKGFKNQFEAKTIKGEKVVFDHASNLMWQQSGSPKYIKYDAAKKYVDDLNKKAFAGFKDWRLPTLEEAMSLMETEKKNGNLYIDQVFDKHQEWIWTSDPVQGESRAWVVLFANGRCSWGSLNVVYSVRAVRSGQSSTE